MFLFLREFITKMMKKIILFTLFLISFTVKAQEDKIETKTIYILGGIATTYTKEDIAFEKKYHIQYHDFGCIAPTNFEEYETKNKAVFNFLKKVFGLQWIKEIKSSAMGLEEWKKS